MKKNIEWIDIERVVDAIIGIGIFSNKDKYTLVGLREEIKESKLSGIYSFTLDKGITLLKIEEEFIIKEFRRLVLS